METYVSDGKHESLVIYVCMFEETHIPRECVWQTHPCETHV